VSHSALYFNINDERIKTSLKKNSDSISIDGQIGAVIYGPYIDLPAGSYEARVIFSGDRAAKGTGTIDACANMGANILKSKSFRFDKLDRRRPYASVEFTLGRPTSHCEVRLHCDPGVAATAIGVEFLGFESTENLIERWTASGTRALQLSQQLAESVQKIEQIAGRLSALSATAAYHSHEFPILRPEHFLAPRLFADRFALISALKFAAPPVVSEIGVASGNFSEFLIKTLRPSEFHAFDKFELETESHVMGRNPRELFEGKTHLEFYRDRFRNVDTRMHLHVGDSKAMLPSKDGDAFDLVYVDAGHYYWDVKRDAYEATRIARRDGVVIFNDYLMYDHWTREPYGVVQAVNELIAETDWKVVAFALQHDMFCDIAVARVAPSWATG
jgi:hypothetical protein